MGRKGILALTQNLKTLSPAGMKLETGQLVDHTRCDFSADLSPELSLFAVELCNAWLSILMAAFPCFASLKFFCKTEPQFPCLRVYQDSI